MLLKNNVWSRSKSYLSDNMYYDQNGFLVCENAILGRSGIYKYRGTSLGLDTTDIVEILRDEEDVFNEESLNSLNLRPFTLEHPREEVTINNVKKYSKGEVYNVRREGDNIVGDIIVKDKAVIDKIVNKELNELSLGYKQDLYYDEESKFYKFKNIIYNHLALVKKGRAGNAMILDSQEEIEVVDEVVEDSVEQKVVETQVEDEKVVETTEEKVEDSKEEEVKETEVVEDKTCDSEEPTEEKEPTKDSANEEKEPEVKEETVTKDSEEIIEKGEEVMVKDLNYFLAKQKEIAGIQDENLRKKMSLVLDSEMEAVLGTTTPTQPDIVVVDSSEEEVVTQTYEERMQEYYDKFNPANYDDPKKAIEFFKKESNYRPKYTNKK